MKLSSTTGALVVMMMAAVEYAHAAVYTIRVGMSEETGKKGIGFDPSSVSSVKSGDIIDFIFLSGVHSAVESTFEVPCLPKEGGFDSGAYTVSDSLNETAAGLPSVQLSITSSDSMWFFDQSAGTCTQSGVFSINPTPASQPDGDFKAAASAATEVAPTSTTSSGSDAPSGLPDGGSGESSDDGSGSGDSENVGVRNLGGGMMLGVVVSVAFMML